MITRRSLYFASVLALAPAYAVGQQVVAVAAVGWARGQPPQPLRPWDKLTVGEKIQFVKQQPFVEGLLILADTNGNRYHRIPCKTEDECAGFYLVPAPKPAAKPGPGSVTQRVFWAVVNTLNSSARFVNLITQPKMSTGPSDGVVPLAGGSLDLCSVFRLATYGEYRLRITRVSQNQADRPAPVEVALVWNGRCPATVSAAGLSPGVHAVEFAPFGSDSLSAQVLICGPEAYESNRAAFDELDKATNDWTKPDSLGDYVSTGARRAFLCAYLQVLAAASGGR